MKTLAILQNQWGHSAHDPDYPSRLADRYPLPIEAETREENRPEGKSAAAEAQATGGGSG